MARRRYYRTRRVYPKQKWAINVNQHNFGVPAAAASSFSIQGNMLIQNPARNGAAGQTVSAAAQILKCAHVKIKGVVDSGMIQAQSVLLALMYCPEGVTPDLGSTALDNMGNTIFYSHPEWVMAWTRMDYSNAAQKNEFSLSSRIKRNLNPGDTIRLVVYNINTNTGTVTAQVHLSATASYCCRAN